MKIGIIASSGGAVFSAVRNIISNNFPSIHYVVITDRECGIEDYCLQHSLLCKRISNTNNQGFSAEAAGFIKENGGVDLIFLFFLRLITEELFAQYPTINIHPSFLPSFSGFNPINKMRKRKSKFIGVTAHLVDNTIDAGNYIVQGVYPVLEDDSLERYYKISYAQKVYVMIVAIEQFLMGNLKFDLEGYQIRYDIQPNFNVMFNPCLVNPELIHDFNEFSVRENVLQSI